MTNAVRVPTYEYTLYSILVVYLLLTFSLVSKLLADDGKTKKEFHSRIQFASIAKRRSEIEFDLHNITTRKNSLTRIIIINLREIRVDTNK